MSHDPATAGPAIGAGNGCPCAWRCDSDIKIAVSLLPTNTKEEGNSYLDIAIATGMGSARNSIIVRSIDAAIAIDGQYGTLSEIAYCLEMGVNVIGLSTWNIEGVIEADSPEDAVAKAYENI